MNEHEHPPDKPVAVAYLRVSTLNQVDGSGYGFDRQRQTIAAWAERTGTAILREYREEGVSGTKDETERPAFSEMVSDLLANGCRTIVVESVDRFARDLTIQLNLMAYLKAKGLTLIIALTGDDATAAMDADPMRRAMVQIQGVFAELEKNMLVRRLKRGVAEKQKTGWKPGKPAFGGLPGEEHAAGVMLWFRRSKMELAEIAERMNAMGLLRRGGTPWDASGICRALKRAPADLQPVEPPGVAVSIIGNVIEPEHQDA